MSNLMDLLNQIEKLAYSLAIWIVLIPKTIIKIFLDPGWVRGYVAKEFAEYAEAEKAGSKTAEKVRFDDYISPVILLLLCSLVPYVGMQFLPAYGFVYQGMQGLSPRAIQGPLSCTEKSPCTYQVEGDYLADSSAYIVQWKCQDEDSTASNPVEGTALTDSTHTVASEVTCTWMTPGTKTVQVEVLTLGEELINETDLSVNVNASGVAAGETPGTTPALVFEGTNGTGNEAEQESSNKAKDLADGLKKNTYVGIIFLLPALAFTLVVSWFKDDKPGQKVISAESLKEVFYAQCYYFTPISLFTYIVLYAFTFGTAQVFDTNVLIFLAFLGMWIWFYRAEVIAVLQERKSKNKLMAHLIVFGTLLVIAIVSWNILGLAAEPEILRLKGYQLLKYGIYFVFFYTVFVRSIINWWKKRRNKKVVAVTRLVDRLPKSGIQN